MSKQLSDKNSRNVSKYRFAIFNDTTHEELFVFRASGSMLLLTVVLAVVFLITTVTLLISFTPLREYIPGYPSAETRRSLVQNAMKLDSLQNVVDTWNLQLVNIQRISKGEKPLDIDSLIRNVKSSPIASGRVEDIAVLKESDSILRKKVLENERMMSGGSTKTNVQIEGLHFFPPVRGIIIEQYNRAINHPFVDIAAEKNSVVSSVLDGTVISAGWNDDSGYTLQVQHDNNLISVYKHNEKLLKKVGDKVSAGTPIALAGGTGKISTGTHLHFELWYKGEPVDPTLYINF